LPFELQQPKDSKWKEGTLYPWGMFHGPRLRGVIRVDRTGTNGCSATMEILRHDLLLLGKPDARFVLDPVSLDAAGQISGFWSQEQVDPVCDLFPYRFRRLQCFAAMPPVGTRVEGRVIIREITERDLRCDLEVLDQAGQVLYRVEDWTDRRFFQQADLWNFRAAPRDTVISTTTPELSNGRPESMCVCLDRFPAGFMDASFGVWGKMISGLMLSRSEKKLWQQMNPADPGRAEWLLRRCAAKDAVRLLMTQSRGVSLFPADIIIQADDRGRFIVNGGWVTRLGVNLVVSAAYYREKAIAIASLNPGDSVGVALAPIDASDRTEISPDEQKLFENLPPESWPEWSVRARCAKAALRDALGRTASDDHLKITGLEPNSGTIRITVPGSAVGLAVPTSRRNDLIYAAYAGPAGSGAMHPALSSQRKGAI
jgi:hypothetical protein